MIICIKKKRNIIIIKKQNEIIYVLYNIGNYLHLIHLLLYKKKL